MGGEWWTVLCSTIVTVIVTVILILFEKLWLKPQRIQSVLRKQGINGPKPSFPYGNISEMHKIPPQLPAAAAASFDVFDEWAYSIFPHFRYWKQRYGSMFVYSTGSKQHLYVEKAELIKELNLHRSLDLGKPTYLSKPLHPLLGNGILSTNGLQWAFQRNLVAPQFFITKIKNMVDIMEECALDIIRTWENRITENKERSTEIVIETDLKKLTEDIISKACFGKNCAQGKQIFAILAAMQAALAKPSIILGFLNLSFIPTKENKEMEKLKKEVDMLMMKIINDREVQNPEDSNENENEKDLLQIILEGAASDPTLNGRGRDTINQLIVDMCKTVYFAGSESSALAVTWTLLLLALHPEWQQRIRSEILETYGNTLPHSFSDMTKLQKLKSLTMVIQESLRLYGPAVTHSREVLAEMKLGEVVLPKGINIWMFIPALHRDTDNWGVDASEFKPERFAGGVSAACKHPYTYVPFGFGSRICLGQNFAVTEMKVVLCLLLYKFTFSVSPNYQHCPVYKMLLVPKYGVRLLVSKA